MEHGNRLECPPPAESGRPLLADLGKHRRVGGAAGPLSVRSVDPSKALLQLLPPSRPLALLATAAGAVTCLRSSSQPFRRTTGGPPELRLPASPDWSGTSLKSTDFCRRRGRGGLRPLAVEGVLALRSSWCCAGGMASATRTLPLAAVGAGTGTCICGCSSFVAEAAELCTVAQRRPVRPLDRYATRRLKSSATGDCFFTNIPLCQAGSASICERAAEIALGLERAA